jgi:rfaE bifunctional protein nucleotidyltransferase chain/domain
MKGKFRSMKSLRSLGEKARRRGKKVVLANGCFDLLHVGHLRYLESARRLGDLLVVAINSDASVRRLKGPGRPLMKLADRVALVSALECVDVVTTFGEKTVGRVLLSLKPDVHAKGGDYTTDTVPERELVRSYGGRVAIAGGAKVRSTSGMIRRLAKFKR